MLSSDGQLFRHRLILNLAMAGNLSPDIPFRFTAEFRVFLGNDPVGSLGHEL